MRGWTATGSKRPRLVPVVTATAVVLAGVAWSIASGAQPDAAPSLRDAGTWMYQIQGLERRGAVERLAQSGYDLIVIEPTNTDRDDRDFDVKSAVRRIKTGKPGRLVLGYVDIGEAEDWRTYWKRSWRAPRRNRRGRPSFIVARDPDGWEGNYPVAFWDRRWKRIIIDGRRSATRNLLRAGFDGIYMDWVEAYDDDRVIKRARRQGVDPERAMVSFIRKLRRVARRSDPGFLVVAQNAPYLIDTPGYPTGKKRVIDGAAFEDTWFRGTADADWGDPKGGDIPQRRRGDYSTRRLIRTEKRYLSAGLPVFTVDYALKRANADLAYRESRGSGFVPLVTRVSLARMTETPPP